MDGIAVEIAIKLLAFARGKAKAAIEGLARRLDGSSEVVSDGDELIGLDGLGILGESNDLGGISPLVATGTSAELEFPGALS